MDTQMLKGVLEGLVLSIIDRAETYGWDILQALGKAGFEDISEGTIYPLLMRLEKKRELVSEMRPSPLGPMRKYYRLSPAGQAALRAFWENWQKLQEQVDKLKGCKNEQ